MPSLLSPVAKEMGSTLGMVEVLSVDKVMWAYCPAEPAPLSNLRMWLPSNCVVRSTEPPAWPVETGITVSSKVKPLKVPAILMGGSEVFTSDLMPAEVLPPPPPLATPTTATPANIDDMPKPAAAAGAAISAPDSGAAVSAEVSGETGISN